MRRWRRAAPRTACSRGRWATRRCARPMAPKPGVLGGVLRPGLDAYANIRPIRLYPGVASALAGRAPGSIDYVVVRENTEGLYASRGRGFVTEDVCLDTMVMTRRGVDRVARRAF